MKSEISLILQNWYNRQPLDIVGIVLLFLLYPYSFNNVKYILLSVLSLIFIWRTPTIYLSKSDLLKFLFIGLAGCTYFWALDIELVSRNLIIWAIYIVWIPIFYNYIREFNRRQYIQRLLQILSIVYCLHCLLGIILIELYHIELWNTIFVKNKNFSSCFLMLTVPFIICDSQIQKKYRVIFLVASGLVVVYTNTIGAFAIWTAFALVFVCKNYKKHIYLLWLAPVVALIALLSSNILAYILELGNARVAMITNTMRLFGDQPYHGVGLGNWFINIGQYPLTIESSFNHPFAIKNFDSHDLYSKLISEVGIFSFLCLLFGLLWPVYLSIRQAPSRVKDVLTPAATFSSIFFIIIVAIYASTSPRPFYFSESMLLAFTSIAMISSSESYRFNFSLTKIVIIPLVGILISCFTLSKINYDKSYRILHDNEKKGSCIEMYQSSLLGHSDFKLVPWNYHKAHHFANIGETSKSNSFYIKALHKRPYDKQILLEYAQFSFWEKRDPLLAFSIGKRFHDIQPNHYNLEMLLVLSSIELRHYVDARYHLNNIYRSEYVPFMNASKLKLYSSKYLTDLIDLTKAQKEKLEAFISQNSETRYIFEKQLGELTDETFQFQSNIKSVLLKDFPSYYKYLYNLVSEEQYKTLIEDWSEAKINYFTTTVKTKIRIDENRFEAIQTLLRDFIIKKDHLVAKKAFSSLTETESIWLNKFHLEREVVLRSILQDVLSNDQLDALFSQNYISSFKNL